MTEVESGFIQGVGRPAAVELSITAYSNQRDEEELLIRWQRPYLAPPLASNAGIAYNDRNSTTKPQWRR